MVAHSPVRAAAACRVAGLSARRGRHPRGAGRRELAALGPLSRDERITAGVFLDVGSGYLTQPELYRLGLLVTLFYLVVFLGLGTGWILLVT